MWKLKTEGLLNVSGFQNLSSVKLIVARYKCKDGDANMGSEMTKLKKAFEIEDLLLAIAVVMLLFTPMVGGYWWWPIIVVIMILAFVLYLRRKPASTTR